MKFPENLHVEVSVAFVSHSLVFFNVLANLILAFTYKLKELNKK